MVFILNSTDVNALKEAGFSNLDFVIVSIGENIESSILTLMTLKKKREALLHTQNLNI